MAALGYPTRTIFPVILALGEKMKRSGKALLEAFILGMEVHGKVGFGYFTAPFHSTPIYGSLGAAAAAAKILGINVEQTRMALGIAASGAGGLGCNVGTMTKPLHAGKAARNGVVAALLARDGFIANRNAIEEHRGFTDAFIREKYDSKKSMGTLGHPFRIVSPGFRHQDLPLLLFESSPFGCSLANDGGARYLL